MLSTILILSVALSTLVLAWRLVWPANPGIASLQQWEAEKHDLDIQIFRALVDETEERYLRRLLSPREFFFLQRRRTRLALDMVRAAEANVEMLMRLGHRARMNGGLALKQEAEGMMGPALRLRLSLLEARLCLYVKWLFPAWMLWVPVWEVKYQDLLGFRVRVQHEQF